MRFRGDLSFHVVLSCLVCLATAWVLLGFHITRDANGTVVGEAVGDRVRQLLWRVDVILALSAIVTHFRSFGLQAVASLVGLALAMHFLVVMFGVPFDQEVELTVLYAWFLAALALPRAVGEKLSLSALQQRQTWEPLANDPALGACIGGWCGAYFVVLDWDQHWQVFPVAPVFSSCVGYGLGAGIAFLRSRLSARFKEG